MTTAKDGSKNNAPFLAFMAPLAAFMVLTSLESQPSMKSWFGALYTLKVAVVGSLLIRFFPAYPRFSTKGFVPAGVFGIMGFGIWIGLAPVDLASYLPESIKSWVTSDRLGFNPETHEPPTRYLITALRLVGLIAMVPIMEELFWRGFLWRYLINESFHQVEWGRYSTPSFVAVLVFFTAVHPEWLAAAAWCAAINALFVMTKNLWACVFAHALTNALLGIYILGTGHYHLW